MEIKRDLYLNKLIVRKQNGFIKVITGVRRCGKSYLLNTLFYNHLLAEGVDDGHIIKFAFDSADDLRLIGEDLFEIDEENRKVDPAKFMDYINTRVTDSGLYFLLLDEVQKLGSFESVLNGYLRKNNMDKEFYLVEKDEKQFLVTITDEFVETRQLAKRITAEKFEIGNWKFTKCSYT